VLVALRFIQGIVVGRRMGRLVLLSMEWPRTDKIAGLIASLRQFCWPAGFLLANLAILALSHLSGIVSELGGASRSWRTSLFRNWLGSGSSSSRRRFSVSLSRMNGVVRAPVVEVSNRQAEGGYPHALARMGTDGSCLCLSPSIFTYGPRSSEPRAISCSSLC